MKTSVYMLGMSLLAVSLSVSNSFAQPNANKTYAEYKLITEGNKAMNKLTRRSDNALRARFFNEINSVLFKKIQTLTDDEISYTSTALKGKVTIIFKISPEKKVEVINIYGNNSTLVSIVREFFEKETLVIPRAMEGKYMLPVSF